MQCRAPSPFVAVSWACSAPPVAVFRLCDSKRGLPHLVKDFKSIRYKGKGHEVCGCMPMCLTCALLSFFFLFFSFFDVLQSNSSSFLHVLVV